MGEDRIIAEVVKAATALLLPQLLLVVVLFPYN